MNTLFVDKNLRYHGLIQAYSRTNRILTKEKPFGNIVCFRDLEQATKVKNDFQAAFPNMTIKMFNFSSVIATYLGEKSLGITWMADIDKMDFSKK